MNQEQFPISSIRWLLVLLVIIISNCCAVPLISATESTRKPSKHILLVENTIPNDFKDIIAAHPALSVRVDISNCGGYKPSLDYTTDLAMDWVCETVRENTITVPQYVYKMQPINRPLWNQLRQHCGCKRIKYRIPYVRLEASSATWILDMQEVPVGTSCHTFENDACRIFRSSRKHQA